MYRSVLSRALLSALALFAAAPAEAGIAPGFPRSVVFATNSVFLEQASEVVSGDVIVNAASPGPTLSSQKELTVGFGVHTPAGYALKADSIKVKKSAVVGGGVFCNDLDDGSGRVTCAPLTLPVFASLPRFLTGPSNGPDVLVGHDAVRDLAPGNYGLLNISSGGVVRFSGGVYNLREIDTGPSATLVFLAPSTVRVAERLDSEPNSFIGPDPATGLAASDVVFYVAGINGSTGNLGATPKAAQVGISNTVRANFYVPNGTLWLRQGTVATGAFLGRDVDVGINVRVTLASAFFNKPPLAVNDAATVARGDAVSVLDSGAASVLANDSDPDLDALTVTTTPVSGPDHGVVVLHADGTFTYTHDGSETLADQFVYQVCDNGVEPGPLCSQATVSITVLPVQAFSQSVVTDQKTPLDITLRGTTSLAETVQISIGTPPAHGALGPLTPVVEDPNAQLVTYTPAVVFSGADSFTFKACISAGCATGTISITVRPASVRVTVTRQGAGSGRVSSAPAGIDCGSICSAGFGSGSTIALFAAPDAGSIFAGWSGDADCADGQLTPDADKSCVATFDLETPPNGDVTVAVSLTGTGTGRVSSDPAGIDCGSVCTATFPAFQRVELIPIADPGSEFAGWSGSGDCLDGFLDGGGNVSCVATFSLLPQQTFTLTVVVGGTGGGTVTSSPAGINCSGVCSATYVPGTQVRLTARADDASVFAGWSGDCVVDPVFSFVAYVTMDAAKTCHATFSQ